MDRFLRRFFLPVAALSRVFRGKFTAGLKQLFRQHKLQFHGSLQSLAEPLRFRQFLRQLFHQDWVVYAKPPFGGPEHVLNYLARYTHRVAISNHRLVAFQNDRVSFRWKDYAHGGKQKIMTVSADEFLRRFLIHVLPKGLVRIRHFGLFANRRRGDALARCRSLLGVTSCGNRRTGMPAALPTLCVVRCSSSSGSPAANFTSDRARCGEIQMPLTRPERFSAFPASSIAPRPRVRTCLGPRVLARQFRRSRAAF